MKKLIDQMVEDIRQGAKDEFGPHKPEFYLSHNAAAGENLSVTVEFSRDPSRSNNGGEYYQDRRYFIGPNGSIHSYLVSSYEDAETEEWTDHGIAGDLGTIERCLSLAKKRVEAEMAPEPILPFSVSYWNGPALIARTEGEIDETGRPSIAGNNGDLDDPAISRAIGALGWNGSLALVESGPLPDGWQAGMVFDHLAGECLKKARRSFEDRLRKDRGLLVEALTLL